MSGKDVVIQKCEFARLFASFTMDLEVIKKSTGLKSMNKSNIKLVLVVVAPILAHILNFSFSSGVIPKNSMIVYNLIL